MPIHVLASITVAHGVVMRYSVSSCFLMLFRTVAANLLLSVKYRVETLGTAVSQTMEAEGLEILARKRKDTDSGMPLVSPFVHDNDSHALHLLTTNKWNLEEFIEPNHARKSII
jgi:hypothetical protein